MLPLPTLKPREVAGEFIPGGASTGERLNRDSVKLAEESNNLLKEFMDIQRNILIELELIGRDISNMLALQLIVNKNKTDNLYDLEAGLEGGRKREPLAIGFDKEESYLEQFFKKLMAGLELLLIPLAAFLVGFNKDFVPIIAAWAALRGLMLATNTRWADLGNILKETHAKFLKNTEVFRKGMAEQFAKVTNFFKELRIGEKFMTGLKSLTTFIDKLFNTSITKLAQDGVEAATKSFQAVRTRTVGALESVTKAVKGIGDWLQAMRGNVSASVSKIPEMLGKVGNFFKTIGNVVKGLFSFMARVVAPVMAVYEAITGAIEGFDKGGIIGAIQGMSVGILNALVGWIVDLGLWIAEKLLKLFGFEDLADYLSQLNFKELLLEGIDNMRESLSLWIEDFFNFFDQLFSKDTLKNLLPESLAQFLPEDEEKETPVAPMAPVRRAGGAAINQTARELEKEKAEAAKAAAAPSVNATTVANQTTMQNNTTVMSDSFFGAQPPQFAPP